MTSLPDGFSYPPQFIPVFELGLTNLEPWWIVQGDELRDRFLGLQARYAHRSLVPFAIRQDNDDVACWDLDRDAIAVIHDFATPGYEQRVEYRGFFDWFRQAVEDFIAFD